MSNPVVVQSVNNPGPSPPQQLVQSTAAQFAALTAPGNALVTFYSIADQGGIATNMEAYDTQANSFTLQNQNNTSQTGGAQTLAVLTASNIPGDTSTGDTVTCSLGPPGGLSVGAYSASFLIEMGLVGPNPVVLQSGNVQNALAPGVNNVLSGNLVITSAMLPCTIVAMAMNTSGNGGAGSTPTAGSSMTQLVQCWPYGSALNTGCVATQQITVAGTYQAAFNNPSSAAEDMAVAAVVLQGLVIAITLMGQICI